MEEGIQENLSFWSEDNQLVHLHGKFTFLGTLLLGLSGPSVTRQLSPSTRATSWGSLPTILLENIFKIKERNQSVFDDLSRRCLESYPTIGLDPLACSHRHWPSQGEEQFLTRMVHTPFVAIGFVEVERELRRPSRQSTQVHKDLSYDSHLQEQQGQDRDPTHRECLEDLPDDGLDAGLCKPSGRGHGSPFQGRWIQGTVQLCLQLRSEMSLSIIIMTQLSIIN